MMLEGCQGPPGLLPPDLPSSVISSNQRVLDQPYTLAILPFQNNSQHVHLNGLSQELQAMLVRDLSKWPHLEVVSREALGPVLREQWLQQRGFSAVGNPVELGQVKGARYLLQGKLYAPHQMLIINLQVIDVETGVIVKSIMVQGPESEIPSLEQDLVTQTLHIFNSSSSIHPPQNSGERTEEDEKNSDTNLRLEEKERAKGFSEQSQAHSVHQIDAFLSLEKLTQQRKGAYELAEQILTDGWIFETGAPIYHFWQLSTQPLRSVPVMAVPVSIFFSTHRLTDIFHHAFNNIASGVGLDAEGFYMTKDDGSGSHQLFLENLHKPRRVFIRARNERGDVLAVFSHWAWRLENSFHRGNPQRVLMPMWPQPFITGFAQFPIDWIEREGQQVNFDAAVIPVPDEQILVMLEALEKSEEDTQSALEHRCPEERLQQEIEGFIRSQWAPAIAEGLPLPGYLPGNKRTAVGRIAIQDGKIVSIQFQSLPDDPFFTRSLQDLQSQLVGWSMECRNDIPVVPPSFQSHTSFRLQLTLIKDMHALQLGNRSN